MIWNHQTYGAPKHVRRVSCREVKLAHAHVDPHDPNARVEIRIAREAQPGDVEVCRDTLVGDIEVDVTEIDYIA